jgi:hypothetical protein
MNPLALLMSKQMQPPAPDYAMPGPAPDMATANAMAVAPRAMQQMPQAQRPSTDMEIADFIQELKPYANSLPPKLQMKMSRLWEMVQSQVGQNEPEPGDQDVADMGAAYGPSADVLQSVLGGRIDRDGPPGSENWNEAQWDEWEEEQDRLGNTELEEILRGYGKGR